MTVGVIYLLTFPDGRKYVGQTQNLPHRLRRHRQAAAEGRKTAICRAWAELDEPACQVIHTGEQGEELDALERKAIADHGTLFPAGLNRYTGGKRGASACEATRVLHGEVSHKRHENPSFRERISEAMKKRNADPAERQRASEQMRERMKDPAKRREASERAKAYQASPEQRQKNRLQTLMRWQDPEYRARTLAQVKSITQRGEMAKNAKVTDAIVRAIREQRSAGVPLASLAAQYGISQPTVSEIANRKKWKHVA